MGLTPAEEIERDLIHFVDFDEDAENLWYMNQQVYALIMGWA